MSTWQQWHVILNTWPQCFRFRLVQLAVRSKVHFCEGVWPGFQTFKNGSNPQCFLHLDKLIIFIFIPFWLVLFGGKEKSYKECIQFQSPSSLHFLILKVTPKLLLCSVLVHRQFSSERRRKVNLDFRFSRKQGLIQSCSATTRLFLISCLLCIEAVDMEDPHLFHYGALSWLSSSWETKKQRNIRHLLTCETRPHTHTHTDHTPLLETPFYNMFTIEPLLMFGYKHCTSLKWFLFGVLQKTLNEQTVNFIHGCDFIWGHWEARTVLHGHGWNNKLDYSTRYCGPNHKITFLDLVNAFRLFSWRESSASLE